MVRRLTMVALAVSAAACTALAGLDGLEFAAQGGAAASGGASSGGTGGGSGGGGTGASGGVGGVADTYAAEVLADLPLAYWRFGETAGPTAVDSSGNGNDGTYIGGVALAEPGVLAGDTAARFDGGDDEMTAGEIFDFAATAPFTVELWIRPDDIGSIGGVVCRYGWDGNNYLGWLLTGSSNVPDGLRFRRTGSPLLEGVSLADGEFNHVAVTFDGVTELLYLNGVEVDSRLPNALVDVGTDPFRVGRAANWGSYAGIIDELAIYDFALPPARIQAHRNAALGSQ